MKHFSFLPSYLHSLPYYSGLLHVNLYAKRDDTSFLGIGGGNKARMLQYLLYDLSPSKYDVLITAGGPCSNFNRACALMCAHLGVKFHLVEYTNNLDEFETSLNYKLCKFVGMTSTRCLKSNVANTINDVIKHYEAHGIRTKFIYGGGKSLEGVYSYFDAVKELSSQIKQLDYLFIACGTGTTLTGVCAGMQKYFPVAKVHAISTARTWEIEKSTLYEDMQLLNSYLSTNYNFDNLVFHDDYLCGGYGLYNKELKEVVHECIVNENMFIDTTYSGKAFYGMLDTIKKDNEFYGKNILFWHTGGIFNLLSNL